MPTVIGGCFVGILQIITTQTQTLTQKLSKYNTFGLMICYFAIMIVIATVGFTINKSCTAVENPLPIGKDMIMVILLALVLFVGESCYIGAYTTGKGDVITISCITVMFPVIASAIKFINTKTLPTSWHVIGFLLAAGAVICINKGSSQT